MSEAMKWYVVHTFSGYEERVRQALLMRIKDARQEEEFGEILVPSEQVIEIRAGKRREVTKRTYPGYIFVNMVFNKRTHHTVNETPRVTGFVGYQPGSQPPPVPPAEIDRIMGKVDPDAERPKATIDFEQGDQVRVVDGPFANFNGVVDDVLEGRSKLRVMVSIFGRATPVELDFTQVEKS